MAGMMDVAAYELMERAHRRVIRAASQISSRGGTPVVITTPMLGLYRLEEEINEGIRNDEAAISHRSEFQNISFEPVQDPDTPESSPEPEQIPNSSPASEKTPRRSTRMKTLSPRAAAAAEAARKAQAAAAATPRRGRKSALVTPPVNSGELFTMLSRTSRKATTTKTKVTEITPKSKSTRSPKKVSLGRAKF